MTFEEALGHWCAPFCALTADQISKLTQHYQLLVRWNRHLNLTTVIEPAAAARKHYAESIFLATHLPAEALRIADIGSGAGFPGFPVAVVRPDASVTLVEADTRKAAFLHECRDLLPSLKVANSRADALLSSAVDKKPFDLLISRAVHLGEVERLVPSLAPRAFALAASGSFTWNAEAPLPWDDKSCVASFGTGKL